MNFQETKNLFNDNLNTLIGLIKSLKALTSEHDHTNFILKSILAKCPAHSFSEIYENLQINKKIIERNRMKCVLFGNTSNGKSATINALLGARVVPSSPGRTTSCFIRVSGTDENEGYLIDQNHERIKLESIEKLANEQENTRYDIRCTLDLFWPKQGCSLLQNDIEIIDTPGVDYSADNDSWIDQCCVDADLFILVVDGCSTLNDSEKRFFTRIRDKIGTRHIFILVNKWDQIESDEYADKEKIKKQHYEEVSKFLSEQMNHSNETGAFSKRIFFISAKEALKQKGLGSITESFGDFENNFIEEMGKNAINAKFRPHIKKAGAIVYVIEDWINIYLKHMNIKCEITEMNFENLKLRIKCIIEEKFNSICQTTKETITSILKTLEIKIQNAVDNRENFDEPTIFMLEDTLPKQISSLFTQNINELKNMISDEFIKFSASWTTSEEIKGYFVGENDLESLAVKYESDILINLKKSTVAIRTLYPTEEKRAEYWKTVLRYTKSVADAMQTPILFACQKAPVVGVVVSLGMSAFQFIPEPGCKVLKSKIGKEFYNFYHSLTGYFLEQSYTQASSRIEVSIENLIKYELQLQDTLSKVVAIQKTCQILKNDLV